MLLWLTVPKVSASGMVAIDPVLSSEMPVILNAPTRPPKTMSTTKNSPMVHRQHLHTRR